MNALFFKKNKEQDNKKPDKTASAPLTDSEQIISQKLEKFEKQTAGSTKLSQLKKLVSSQLKEISAHIEEYQNEVRIKHKLTQHKIDEMASRIILMEFEAIQLRAKLKMVQNRALKDPLTHLPNRLAYDDRLITEIARWKRFRTPLSLVILDVDHFKLINDTYGHYSGDKTLSLIARLLLNQCRKTDFIARYGGEEFVMLLPDTGLESALHLANQIRLVIERTGFNSRGQAVRITISCGASEFGANDSGESVFERADQALYKAKKQGRNRCVGI
ncbi:MAG: GGDEF domain-containing protein [Gammaproteobacteria bacterium]